MTAAEPFSFTLPASLNACMPPERRGIRRDHVRMLAVERATGAMVDGRFFELPTFLRPGDLLVLNASRTLPASLSAEWHNGRKVEVRLARRVTDREWQALVVGERAAAGETLRFSADLTARVLEAAPGTPLVTLSFSHAGIDLYNRIYRLGEPVRYEYVDHPWELDYYQTVYASAPGSVEMPSAGRAFSWELLFRLRRKGIGIAYLQLHTGLSDLLDDSRPHHPAEHAEAYAVPAATAEAVNRCKASGGRVIAVGTTVVRALETAADERGIVAAQTGWTRLHIDGGYRLRAVDGLITGFHEPRASHLDLLTAFLGPDLLGQVYRMALEKGYLWHEFGDMNLIL
ncbi:S-adenosylmethionine:tRNA ribosyltransferase-isomerase [Brevibacillus sp. SYP-B805]|uniref:S-adenosylmethionine:tRNA ribosyltransferase-isomerase n=1 Tax=Brevibacillus sp. SYP-B805 TaxID=1578199 RepID=UPI0013ED766F|nr:S-adenosylmethionine:tRNA ribosyltransferase-isomerase [Brevibacillus sp. SYP-B805]NGQ95164.1 S-adenosylmethionine:tRNA ribosyltransferase-isomerase [Brevibacillus sp. SYP-B805]